LARQPSLCCHQQKGAALQHLQKASGGGMVAAAGDSMAQLSSCHPFRGDGAGVLGGTISGQGQPVPLVQEETAEPVAVL